MTIRDDERKELKKLMDWHFQQANQSNDTREFHIWAATLLSLVREVR
jgi:hypothetical protein